MAGNIKLLEKGISITINDYLENHLLRKDRNLM